MAKYKVWVCLEAEYDDIEADNEDEDEAFIVASDAAMSGESWSWSAELVDDEEDGEEDENNGNQRT